MAKKTIYTPGELSPSFLKFKKGDRVEVYIKETGEKRKGIVESFPKNSYDDTDVRVVIVPEKKDWFGSITVSAENNWYGNFHISEVRLKKLYYNIKMSNN